MAGQDRQSDSAGIESIEGETLALYLNKDESATLALMAKNYSDIMTQSIALCKKQMGTASPQKKEHLKGELKMYQELQKFSVRILNEASGIFEELDKPKKPGLIIQPNG